MVEYNGLVRVSTLNSQQTINTYKVSLLWIVSDPIGNNLWVVHIMNIWRYIQLLYYKLYCSKYNFQSKMLIVGRLH